MREAALGAEARAYYEIMSEAERAEVRRIRTRLEHDPAPDGWTTHDIPGVPSLLLYDDGAWQVLYAVPDEATVVIRSIAHALDLPG